MNEAVPLLSLQAKRQLDERRTQRDKATSYLRDPSQAAPAPSKARILRRGTGAGAGNLGGGAAFGRSAGRGSPKANNGATAFGTRVTAGPTPTLSRFDSSPNLLNRMRYPEDAAAHWLGSQLTRERVKLCRDPALWRRWRGSGTSTRRPRAAPRSRRRPTTSGTASLILPATSTNAFPSNVVLCKLHPTTWRAISARP
jgi:hypothetical protein